MDLEVIKLTDRSIIELKGSDVKEFLQGLITNNIYKIDSKNLIYCAMLSPKGRFLYDLFIFEGKSSVFLDVFKEKCDEIIKKLSFYKLKKDVQISRRDDLGAFSTLNNNLNGYVFNDPRSEKLGFRAYFNDLEAKNSIESAKIRENMDFYEYNRIKNKIPESEKDLTVDKSIINEFGLDNFGAVDYEKGCYVGQELTARTHHLGQVRKKIFLCKFDGGDLIEKNSEIFANNSKIGLALSSVKYNNEIYGLALIKSDESLDLRNIDLTVNNIKIEILE